MYGMALLIGHMHDLIDTKTPHFVFNPIPPAPSSLSHYFWDLLLSAEDVLGAEGEALRWFPYPWEGGVDRDTSPAAAGLAEHPSEEAEPLRGTASRCIVNPKVYGAGVVLEEKVLDSARVSSKRSSEEVAEELDGGADKIYGVTGVLASTHAEGEVDANGVSSARAKEVAGGAAGPAADPQTSGWNGEGQGAEVGTVAKYIVNRDRAVVAVSCLACFCSLSTRGIALACCLLRRLLCSSGVRVLACETHIPCLGMSAWPGVVQFLLWRCVLVTYACAAPRRASHRSCDHHVLLHIYVRYISRVYAVPLPFLAPR